MNTGFESFSMQHFSALFVFGMVTYAAIAKGKASEEPLKTNIGLILAGLTFSSLIIEAIVKMAWGTYDILVDLPFFMCDLVAMMLPFVLYNQNRKWIGIVYFWALAGTMQALITPDIEAGFPSFHYFRYFITHAGIITAVLYTVIVRRVNIGWQDFINAIIFAQVYLVAVHMVNQFMGSNYAYTMQKPPGPSILDVLGPWPWYIFWGEVLMITLFLILLIPFLILKGKSGEHNLNAEDSEW
jgi:hypothetical integral membrane protein (TIGR02206 family)